MNRPRCGGSRVEIAVLAGLGTGRLCYCLQHTPEAVNKTETLSETWAEEETKTPPFVKILGCLGVLAGCFLILYGSFEACAPACGPVGYNGCIQCPAFDGRFLVLGAFILILSVLTLVWTSRMERVSN